MNRGEHLARLVATLSSESFYNKKDKSVADRVTSRKISLLPFSRSRLRNQGGNIDLKILSLLVHDDTAVGDWIIFKVATVRFLFPYFSYHLDLIRF